MDTHPTDIAHPDDAPVSPYDESEIEQLRPSAAKSRLKLLGGKIRRQEKTLRRYLSDLGKPTDGDLLNVTVETDEVLQNHPGEYEKVERVEQLQSQLELCYSQWQSYCEQHQRETSSATSQTNKSV